MVLDSLFQFGIVLKTSSFALLVFVILTISSKIVKLVKNFLYFNSFPGDKNYSPIFGNLHNLPRTGEGRIAFGKKHMLQHNRRYARFWFGPVSPVITLYHPDTLKLVLKSSAPKSRGFGAVYEHVLPWIGEGLISSNGQRWARSRRLLTPAFHFDILKPYTHIYNEAADTLLEKLDTLADSGEKFDLCPLLTLCTLEVILKCAMSYDIDIQKKGHHPYADAAKELVKTWSYRTRTPYLWPDFIFRLTPSGRRFYKNCDYVHSVAEEIIEKRKKTMESGGLPRGRHLDFLDILLTARDEDGKPMTTEEIRNEVDTFMFAGHDTTATGAPWILYCLAKYPEYQKQVQSELDDVLAGRDSNHIEWSDIPKLTNLALCIKEAFRLYPPVPFIQRSLNEDIELDGKTVPAGTVVSIPIIHVHRNPDVWDKPEEFIPERFTKENMEGRDSFAYIPFSAGSRNCIGQNFALQEEKVILGRILARYHVEIAEDGPPAERHPQAVLKTENGLWFRLKKRQS